MVKPSAYSPATSEVIRTILAECFPPEYVFVVTGGRAENQALLEQRFDKIFFTGGKTVGREVLRHAAEYLTPRHIGAGRQKPLHCGRHRRPEAGCPADCVRQVPQLRPDLCAPDYLYCEASIRDELVLAIQKEITAQFGAEAAGKTPTTARSSTASTLTVSRGLIDPAKVVTGGHRR